MKKAGIWSTLVIVISIALGVLVVLMSIKTGKWLLNLPVL